MEYKIREKLVSEVENYEKETISLVDKLYGKVNTEIRKDILEYARDKKLVIISEDKLLMVYGTHDDANKLEAHLLHKYSLIHIEFKHNYHGFLVTYNCIGICVVVRISQVSFIMSYVDSEGYTRESYEQKKLRSLEIYSDPVGSVELWKDTLLQDDGKNIKPEGIESTPKGYELRNEGIKKILDEIIHRKDVIVSGTYAYNSIVKTYGYTKKVFIPYLGAYEVLTQNVDDVVNEVKKEVERVFHEPILTKKNTNTIGTTHAPKVTITFKGSNILEILDISGKCIPFNVLDGIQYANPHVILKYFYVGLWVAHKIGAEQLVLRLKTMIYYLNWMFEDYLKEKKLTGLELESGLFRVFQIDGCIGKYLNEERKSKIKGYLRKVK